MNRLPHVAVAVGSKHCVRFLTRLLKKARKKKKQEAAVLCGGLGRVGSDRVRRKSRRELLLGLRLLLGWAITTMLVCSEKGTNFSATTAKPKFKHPKAAVAAVAEEEEAMKSSRLHYPKPSFVPPQPRDSDASFASSRPSSVGISVRSTPADLASDRSYHQSAIRSINAYLASHSIPLHLQPASLPSSKDIALLLNSILSHLHFPNPNFADHLPPLLKSLNCPFKLSKSSLRTPNTPHAWPHLIPVIHWLVQLSSFLQHSVAAAAAAPGALDEQGNSIHAYARESYLRFIRGEDDAEEELDRGFVGKLERERDSLREGMVVLEKEAGEFESLVEGMRTGVSLKEVKEGERKVLEEDVRKFEAMIGEIRDRMDGVQKVLKEKEEELRVKEEEKRRVDEENDELRKAVNAQTVNARDVERMKRELTALEREITDAEGKRNRVEEKCWEVDSVIGQKFKELEDAAIECNKAIRKFGSFFSFLVYPHLNDTIVP